MRRALDFVGLLAFLFGMLLAGVAAAIALFTLAQLAGATDDIMQWLYLPIGVAAVFACGAAGKYGAGWIQKHL